MSIPLFVYGTLKRGFPAQALLQDQQFFSPAWTMPRFRLFDSGSYPCLVEDPDQGVMVEGELWLVTETALARLDEYEGAPSLFARKEIQLQAPPGTAWAYLFRGDVSRFPDAGTRYEG